MPPAPDSPTIRLALPGDLPRLWEIRAASDAADPLDPPPPGPMPPVLEHLLRHGTLLVTERDGRILGFAGRITRGDVVFLTDLFVDPAAQSAAIGRTLLQAILPPGSGPRCTLASADPRAIALYARAGMAPRWPNLNLVGHAAGPGIPVPEGISLEATGPTSAEMVDFDREIGLGSRPQDFAFFAARQAAEASWVLHAGQRAGYAVIRQDAADGPRPGTLTIGPVGARSPEVARGAALAAVDWARGRAPRLEISVPGPHLALADLLAAGFRIDYVETFCAAASVRINPALYIGSGGDLF